MDNIRSWRNIKLALQSLALWSAVVLGILAAGALIGLSSIDNKYLNEFDTELRKAAVVLISGGVLGGILKFLFDVVSIERDQRNDTVEFLRNSLNDLKSVFDQVDTSRTNLRAFDTFEVYESEIAEINSALVKLRNVKRAFLFSAQDLNEDFRVKIVEHLEVIGEFLNGLSNEFAMNYATASRSILKDASGTASEDPGAAPYQSLKGYVHENQSRWANTSALLDVEERDSRYNSCFTCRIDKLSKLLRNGLRDTISGRSLAHSLNDKSR